ncbi:hypothetical protein K1Y80_42585 [Streptomyces sp. MAG02]|nr:hypothetical protein [Streptomyces sp. MAG02]
MSHTCHTCGHTDGNRTQHCVACHQSFNSTTAGDMHRVGDHGTRQGPNRRRCLTPDEMRHKGMTQNPQGVWMAARKLNQQEITRKSQS